MLNIRKIGSVLALSLIVNLLPNLLYAKDLKASLAYLPTLIDDEDTGGYVEFIKAIDEAYPDGRIIRRVYPFLRSVRTVIQGEADFHMPLLVNPLIPESTLPFRYSTEDIGFVVFVLYTHSRTSLTKHDLLHARYTFTEKILNNFLTVKGLERLSELKDTDYPNRSALLRAIQRIVPNSKLFEKYKHKIALAAFPYTLSTDRAHTPFFSFPVNGSSSITQGLRMLELGRIDGFIFAQEESDFVLRKLKLNRVKREKFQTYEVKLVLSKGENGKEIDQLLTDAIRKLKTTEKHQVLVNKVHAPYQSWQPSEMSWQ